MYACMRELVGHGTVEMFDPLAPASETLLASALSTIPFAAVADTLAFVLEQHGMTHLYHFVRLCTSKREHICAYAHMYKNM